MIRSLYPRLCKNLHQTDEAFQTIRSMTVEFRLNPKDCDKVHAQPIDERRIRHKVRVRGRILQCMFDVGESRLGLLGDGEHGLGKEGYTEPRCGVILSGDRSGSPVRASLSILSQAHIGLPLIYHAQVRSSTASFLKRPYAQETVSHLPLSRVSGCETTFVRPRAISTASVCCSRLLEMPPPAKIPRGSGEVFATRSPDPERSGERMRGKRNSLWDIFIFSGYNVGSESTTRRSRTLHFVVQSNRSSFGYMGYKYSSSC